MGGGGRGGGGYVHINGKAGEAPFFTVKCLQILDLATTDIAGRSFVCCLYLSAAQNQEPFNVQLVHVTLAILYTNSCHSTSRAYWSLLKAFS